SGHNAAECACSLPEDGELPERHGACQEGTWDYGAWGACGQESCLRTRGIECTKGDAAECACSEPGDGQYPARTEQCEQGDGCPYLGNWKTGAWACRHDCTGEREVRCEGQTAGGVSPECDPATRPANTSPPGQACVQSIDCPPSTWCTSSADRSSEYPGCS
ncbi:unnamed protein product, partial [marine sediment metagenome]